ncbi:aminopeptidase [Halobacterium salinarum]|uniref:aminopeptidase n=1 Tax=Halobacterium salinarum TaxID=2242 RepID=UPI0025568769|nr:aminopeptidase [Halobacterium salinarum]MDL0143411.1 aminopeptidase [Halobacterium salinarum]
MDPRVEEHAEVLVDWSARIEAGDNVVLSVGPDAHELAVAVAERVGERGANLVTTYASGEIDRAYQLGHEGDFDADPAHERALVEHADVCLFIGGGRNTSAAADVPATTREAYNTAHGEIREARMDTDWVKTVHPTRSLAQQGNMSFAAYQEFVYDAVLRDWEALADRMANMKTILDEGSEVRLVTEDTDLTMRIAGRQAVNSAASVAYDSHNLPSGEVFTAPTATEGEVHFDVPMTLRGERVQGVHLTFEDGEVVDYAAAQNEGVVGEILETDAGAKRLGELGIGMNRGIDQFTDSILFDEKMGDTIHLALGRAYESNFPAGSEDEANESAVHVDMITDVSEDSYMEVDGEIVQRNGTFRWEDGFSE